MQLSAQREKFITSQDSSHYDQTTYQVPIYSDLYSVFINLYTYSISISTRNVPIGYYIRIVIKM